jgi:hypothetical protein
LLVVAVASSAQDRAGSLAGTTRNENGEPFHGVVIEAATPVLIERVRSATSSEEGRYQFPVGLPEGTYKLTFTFRHPIDKERMATRTDCASQDNVVVKPGERTIVDAVLKFCREDKVTIITVN